MARPPDLRALERRLFGVIRAPQGDEAGTLDRLVHGDVRLSARGRVEIYADMYFARLLEVLRGAFPKLALALGDDAFSTLAADYLDACPSRHPSLRFLGDRLAEFLRARARSARRSAALPGWASDLAALEWARYDVFDDADAPLLTRGALGRLDPAAFATLPVRLQPAHRVLTTATAVETVWRALARGEPAPAPARAASALLVWRQDTMFVYHRRIADLEREALALAARGCSFAALCEAVAARVAGDEGAATAAFQLLAGWVDDGLLVDMTAPDSNQARGS